MSGHGGQGGTDVCEEVFDAQAERLGADSNNKADEDDKHGVFGGSGAALVPAKAIDQTEHLRVLLLGVALWPVRPFATAIAT